MGRTLFALLVVITVGFVLLYGPTLGPGSQVGSPRWDADTSVQFHPWIHLTKTMLKDGVLPLWNPYNGLGRPFAANPQSALFFPLTWLNFILPETLVSFLAVYLKLLIAGTGAFFLLWRMRLTERTAFVGGVAFAFMPHLFAYVPYPVGSSEMLIPWALAFTQEYLESRSWRPVLLLAAVLALQLFGGQPQTWLVTVLFVLAYFLWFSWPVPDGERFPRFHLRFFAFVPFMAALAAPQLLPFIEYLPESYSYQLRHLYNWSYCPPSQPLHLVLPAFFGDPIHYNEWGWAGYIDIILYAGIPVLILATLFFLGRGNWREKSFYLMVLGLFFLFYFRRPAGVINFLLHLTPFGAIGFNKYHIFFDLCLLIPAMKQLDCWHWAALRLKLAWVGAGALVVAGVGWVCFSGFIRELGLAGFQARNALILVGVLAALAGVLKLWNSDRPRLAALLLSALVLVDLYVVDCNFVEFVRRESLYPPGCWMADVPVVGPGGVPNRIFAPDIPPEINLVYGFASLATYDAMFPARTVRVISLVDRRGNTYLADVPDPQALELDRIDRGTLRRRWLAGLFDIYGSGMYQALRQPKPWLPPQLEVETVARLLAIRWAVHRSATTQPWLIPDGQAGDWHRYRLPDPAPVAGLYATVRFARTDQAAWAELAGNPARSLIEPIITLGASQKPPVPPSVSSTMSPGQGATIKGWRPDRVEIETLASTDAWLVLRDLYYPGWEAQIDGQTAPILTADYAFRAVTIPAGRHRVVFQYRPWTFRLGLEIFLVTVLLLGLIGAVQRWVRPKKKGQPVETP